MSVDPVNVDIALLRSAGGSDEDLSVGDGGDGELDGGAIRGIGGRDSGTAGGVARGGGEEAGQGRAIKCPQISGAVAGGVGGVN